MPTINELVLAELRAIRKLLEWQKADTLARRIELKAEEEQCKAEAMAMNEAMLEKAKANALEVARQAYREHEPRSRAWHPMW